MFFATVLEPLRNFFATMLGTVGGLLGGVCGIRGELLETVSEPFRNCQKLSGFCRDETQMNLDESHMSLLTKVAGTSVRSVF